MSAAQSADWYTPPAGYAIPESWNLSEDAREFLREQVWTMILQGEGDPEIYVEMFSEDLDEAGIDDAEAERFFASVIDLRRTQQRALGGLPDAPLRRAFAELASIGVIGRENFTCCGTCGSEEIWDERDDSRTWRGYLYYHEQDAEVIPESRDTYVGYGAFLDAFLPEDEWNALSESARERRYARIVTELMHGEVFPILEKHGVRVTWDGDLGTRILLSNVDAFFAV